ncbi:DUF6247 family protein [Nocardia sp. NPDC058640]|uniref:DUF6247 family protein n=1 Tax=Nocardia sp. NPDC058640 TaxID=3346571 RepID=UPI003646234B
MAAPAAVPHPDPVPPAADPAQIRACLTPTLIAVFDAEWELVLDEAKRTKELDGIRNLLNHWRHIAYDEMVEPGTYFRLQATAEQIQQTGMNSQAATIEEMRALIRQRLEG